MVTLTEEVAVVLPMLPSVLAAHLLVLTFILCCDHDILSGSESATELGALAIAPLARSMSPDPKLYRDEKDMRLESRSGSDLEASGAASGSDSAVEIWSFWRPSSVGVLSLSSMTIEFRILLPGSTERRALSEALEGLLEEYCRGLSFGGGMLMLALSTSPLDVSASAKRLFRVERVDAAAAER